MSSRVGIDAGHIAALKRSALNWITLHTIELLRMQVFRGASRRVSVQSRHVVILFIFARVLHFKRHTSSGECLVLS